MSTVVQFRKTLATAPPAVATHDIAIRTFGRPGDVELWLDLRQRAFARERIGVRAWTSDDFAAEMLSAAWWSADRVWFALRRDAGPGERPEIGALALAERGAGQQTLPAIHWLVVDPRWRRRGAGRLLVETAEAFAFRHGWREIVLETHAAWTAANRFYEQLGYSRR